MTGLFTDSQNVLSSSGSQVHLSSYITGFIHLIRHLLSHILLHSYRARKLIKLIERNNVPSLEAQNMFSLSLCLEPELSKGPLLFSSRPRERILYSTDGISPYLQTSSGLSPPGAGTVSAGGYRRRRG